MTWIFQVAVAAACFVQLTAWAQTPSWLIGTWSGRCRSVASAVSASFQAELKVELQGEELVLVGPYPTDNCSDGDCRVVGWHCAVKDSAKQTADKSRSLCDCDTTASQPRCQSLRSLSPATTQTWVAQLRRNGELVYQLNGAIQTSPSFSQRTLYTNTSCVLKSNVMASSPQN